MSNQELIDKGKKAMMDVNYKDALKTFDKLLKEEPSNAEALYLKGQALNNLGKFPEAMGVLGRALQLVRHEPNFAIDIMIEMGTALLEMNRFGDAEKLFDGVLAMKPKIAWAWVEKSRIAARRKNFIRSVGYCDRAIAIDATEPRAWNNKAFALLQLNLLDDCIECAREAISLKDDYTTAWFWLGQAYAKKGNVGKAEECLAKANSFGKEGMVFVRRGHKPIH